MTAPQKQRIGGKALPFRRKVYYIPGYDPFPPRRYRELFRSEAAEQARISGYRVNMAPRQERDSYGWGADGEIDGFAAYVDFEVLIWSDIVRDSMSHGILATYLQLLRTVWVYVSSGALVRLMRLRKGPMIAALYPIVVLLLELTCAVALGLAAAWGGRLAAVAMTKGVATGSALWLLSLGGGFAVAWWGLRAFRRADKYIYAWYLMHDYAFTAGFRGANPPALEQRIAAFGVHIADALEGNWDEVLVVGHSSGAHLAVSVLADLIRSGRWQVGGGALGFLSLGQVVPMVSFLPDAGRLRDDLALLSERAELTWVDVTAPGDGCAFALCDPVAVSGMAGPDKRWPLVISAAFSQTLSPERWKALRWRFFRLHFQYLCAFDRPGDYDYFAITTGAQTLSARFAGRTPSKSCIETPLNHYGARQ
jgi:hypothetical protein